MNPTTDRVLATVERVLDNANYFRETTWAKVEVGDCVLVPHRNQTVKAEVTAVEKGQHSVLIDYVYEGRGYYALFFTPNQTAYVQQED